MFLLHRIKRPQPDDYCANLVQTLQQQQPLLEATELQQPQPLLEATESIEATIMPNPPTVNVTPVAKPTEETYSMI